MPVSKEAQLIGEISEHGIDLDSAKKYTKDQLSEILEQLKLAKQVALKNIPKFINETSQSCIGGQFEQTSLRELTDKIIKVLFR